MSPKKLLITCVLTFALFGGATAIIYGNAQAAANPHQHHSVAQHKLALKGPTPIALLQHYLYDKQLMVIPNQKMPSSIRLLGISLAVPNSGIDIGNHPWVGGLCYSIFMVRCCYNTATGGFVSCICLCGYEGDGNCYWYRR